jgi:hypothetical protein
MAALGGAAAAGSTASVVVVVVDLVPARLAMTVPTYLLAADLSQRIARDAGLEAYWPDGTRRTWTLRARGRILEDGERLADLGVGDSEMVWLLPEPPAGSPALERAYVDRPDTRAGPLELGARAGALVLLGGAWAAGATALPSWWTGLWPALGVGVLASRLSARAWGGRAMALRVPITAGLLGTGLALVASAAPLVGSAAPVAERIQVGGGAFLGVLTGILVGWLASLGAVDPLPVREATSAEGPARSVACGVCGGPVDAAVLATCPHAGDCARAFHAGCMRARQAVARGAGCAVCGRA